MKWKILLKFIYLIALLAYAASEGEEEPQLIDSDPVVEEPSLLNASLGD